MKKLTPLRVIREKCLDCSGGQRGEVRRCPVTKCALWLFRFGHNPKPKPCENQGVSTANDAGGIIPARGLTHNSKPPFAAGV